MAYKQNEKKKNKNYEHIYNVFYYMFENKKWNMDNIEWDESSAKKTVCA